VAKDYFPELTEYYPTVTLKDLGTFTSGYNNVPGHVLEPAEPMYAPVTAFHYSSQSDILAYTLTEIAKEPLHKLFKRRIADEIGITDEAMDWQVFATNQDNVAVNGGSGATGASVIITARAMARFGWLYANNGVWDGKRLVSQEYIEFASQPQVSALVPMYDKRGWYADLPGRYGLNRWTNDQNLKKEWLWQDAPKNTFAAQGNKNNICFIMRD
jgi:CubicO group peptidase (beta-lactamase class C family)